MDTGRVRGRQDWFPIFLPLRNTFSPLTSAQTVLCLLKGDQPHTRLKCSMRPFCEQRDNIHQAAYEAETSLQPSLPAPRLKKWPQPLQLRGSLPSGPVPEPLGPPLSPTLAQGSVTFLWPRPWPVPQSSQRSSSEEIASPCVGQAPRGGRSVPTTAD